MFITFKKIIFHQPKKRLLTSGIILATKNKFTTIALRNPSISWKITKIKLFQDFISLMSLKFKTMKIKYVDLNSQKHSQILQNMGQVNNLFR